MLRKLVAIVLLSGLSSTWATDFTSPSASTADSPPPSQDEPLPIREVRAPQVPQGEELSITAQPQGQDNSANSGPVAPNAIPLQGPDSGANPADDASQSAPAGDLWERIRGGFALSDMNLDAPLVAHHIAWLSARPDYVERTLNRSRMYLYFIVHEVQRRGMPTEVALLPLVESAFNPHAISRSQASGMWQFIPSTARLFGLQQNWWYDGRKDIVSTTYSALDYLQRLHDEFQDWDLALAGYNCGEGKIRREIAYNRAHGRPTDLEHLNLPDETRNYIPRLLAAKAIVMAPEHYGLVLPPIPDQPYFVSVTTTKPLDVKVAADFCHLSEEDFLMLNPGFSRPLIQLSEGRDKTILVPVTEAQSFLTRLADPQAQLVSWAPHRLHRGEPLERVAQEYGMTGDELKRVNGIAANRKLAGGGLILVPTANSDKTTPQDNPTEIKDVRPEAELSAPALAAHPRKTRGGAHHEKTNTKASSSHHAQHHGKQTHKNHSSSHASKHAGHAKKHPQH